MSEKYRADEEEIYFLGYAWFNAKSDVKKEELGQKIKTYTLHRDYGDIIEVTVYEHGASVRYIDTEKYFRNKGEAFRIARNLKMRIKKLYSLLG
jgi:hypothetical protein